jgi:hypothetical protein
LFVTSQCRYRRYKVGIFSLPDYFGVLADDVQLEHVPALHTLYEPQRHLYGETERGHHITQDTRVDTTPLIMGAPLYTGHLTEHNTFNEVPSHLGSPWLVNVPTVR